MPIRFEELTKSTHQQVRSLILAGLEQHWGSIDESLNPDLDDMLTSYQNGRTLVARDTAGDIVGTGTLILRSDHVAEIVRMSVDSSVRRRGVGRQIVDELVATARANRCERVILETTSTWTEVIEFYQSCGFTITHVEVGEFGSDTWFELLLI